MRHIEVTHTYVIAVEEDEAQDASLDSVANAGVSMMERQMKALMPGREISSNWKLMPREYTREVQANTPRSISQAMDEERVATSQELAGMEAHSPGADRMLPQARHIDLDEDLLDSEGRMKDPHSDSELAKRMIEADADQGINLTRDVFGERGNVTHPWDQGLRVFPLDHPHAQAETIALAQKGRLCAMLGESSDKVCALVANHTGKHNYIDRTLGGQDLRQLTAGE